MTKTMTFELGQVALLAAGKEIEWDSVPRWCREGAVSQEVAVAALLNCLTIVTPEYLLAIKGEVSPGDYWIGRAQEAFEAALAIAKKAEQVTFRGTVLPLKW